MKTTLALIVALSAFAVTALSETKQLAVDPNTGEIKGPISASTFASSNSFVTSPINTLTLNNPGASTVTLTLKNTATTPTANLLNAGTTASPFLFTVDINGTVHGEILQAGNGVYGNRSYTTGAGSANNPAFTLSTDPDTGMFFNGANTLSFTVGATEKLRIDGSGVYAFTALSSTGAVSGLSFSGSNAIGTTSTDGIFLENPTAATNVSQTRKSPRVRYRADGWKTNATAASQHVDVFSELATVAGTANPSGTLNWLGSVNGAGATTLMSLDTGGTLSIPKNLAFGTVGGGTFLGTLNGNLMQITSSVWSHGGITMFTDQLSLGDLGLDNNHTYFSLVDDATRQIILNGMDIELGDSGTNTYIKLDSSNGEIKIGDVNGVSNATQIWVKDAIGDIQFGNDATATRMVIHTTGGAIEIGDYASLASGTSMRVDVGGSYIDIKAPSSINLNTPEIHFQNGGVGNTIISLATSLQLLRLPDWQGVVLVDDTGANDAGTPIDPVTPVKWAFVRGADGGNYFVPLYQ